MPSDLIAERLRIVTGSMEYTISALNIANPNGAVTEPSGSIVRTQDGRIWTNTDGGTVWVDTGPSRFTTLSGTIDARFLDITGSLISSIASTNSSLSSGATASLAAQYTMMIAGTTASDAAVQVSLKAAVTSSFASWGSNLQILGSITGSGDATFSRHVNVAGALTASMGLKVVGNGLPTNRTIQAESTTQANILAVGDSNNAGSDAGYTGFIVGRGSSAAPTELWFVGRNGTDVNDGFIIRRSAATNDMRISTTGRVDFSTNVVVGTDLFVSGSITGSAMTIAGAINAGSIPLVTSLSGTIDARFLNLTGSLISGLAEVYSTLAAGSTASLASQYTMMIAGTTASDAAVQASLKAGVTASFDSWNGSVQITGNLGVTAKTVLRGGGAMPDATLGGIEFGVGRNSTDETAGYGSIKDIAFNWFSTGGGYRHWISTNHNAAANDIGNAIKFWLNDSTGSIGSLAPNTGSYLALSLHGDRTVRTSSSLVVAGSMTGTQLLLNGGGINAVYGETQFIGPAVTTHINWLGDGSRPTYIRAGTVAGAVNIGDSNTGEVKLGAATNNTRILGDVIIAGSITGSGDALFSRNVSIVGATNLSGSVNIGNASGDAHALAGTISMNGTAGTNGQMLAILSGIPQWSPISGISGVTGLGVTNSLALWSSTTNIIQSYVTQDSGGVSVATQFNLVPSVTGTSTAYGAVFNTARYESGSVYGIYSQHQGDLNTTTLSILASDAGTFRSITRNTGVGTLYNRGVSAYASGADYNYAIIADAPGNGTCYAIYADHGDVVLNFSSGGTRVVGSLTGSGDVIFSRDLFVSRNINATVSVTASLDLRVGRDATIVRNFSAAGSVTASLDLNVGRDANVVGSLTASFISAQRASVQSITGSSYAVGATAARMFLNRQKFATVGSTTYTPTAGTKAIIVKMVGGGGGGAGAAVNSAGGGGGSGLYWEKWFSALTSATGTVVIGNSGSAGTAGGGAGGTGGDTTFSVNSVTYLTKGGTGGATGNAVPGSPGTGETAGWDVIAGSAGDTARVIAGAWWSGFGGSNPIGVGGPLSVGTGTPGRGYGGGGSGANGNLAGASGSIGAVIIDEYG